MTAILGISAFYHDSAAALLVDGEIVAAAQEERFTRNKHDESFPAHAIEYCLAEAGLRPEQLDYVGFYDKPLSKFERLLETYLSYAPRGYRSFRLAMATWLRKKLHLPREIREGLDHGYRGRCVFMRHHESHAASAFFPSPFERAAIVTLDGVGEWATTTIGHGAGNRLRLQEQIRYPHSLGLLYSAFTYYTGFRVNSGEYKLMGLAPYGEPRYREQILRHLIDLRNDGSYRLDMRYFNYCQGLTMTSPRFHDLFGGPPREPESELTQRDMDLAASIQSVTEEAMLGVVRRAHALTGERHLVLAGGVALNCVGNGRLLREGPFEQVWIQPAAGDAGGALGAATFIWHQLLGKPRVAQRPDSQRGSRLGPGFGTDAIQAALDEGKAVYEVCDSDEQLCQRVAEAIADEQVVGWFQGRLEFGPRALGSRSILGDARSERMQSVMNRKIKFRESFRPFAPIVLAECADEYFDLRGHDSPYMLLVADVAEQQRLELSPEAAAARGLEKRLAPRSRIPAVTHVDNSARIQTVDAGRDPLLHRLLSEFRQLTGCGVMINTSFNVRSEPIVCTPADALRCFYMTDMDLLVLGRFVLQKNQQTRTVDNRDRELHLSQFQLD
ncbi:MAG: carbamoyltransferase [Planctomycetales bacterium]|nr:carbamoyltransferase [Planctomycetales bacterium]